MHKREELFENIHWEDGQVVTAKQMSLIIPTATKHSAALMKFSQSELQNVIEVKMNGIFLIDGVLEFNRILLINKSGDIVDFRGSINIDTKSLTDGQHIVYCCTGESQQIDSFNEDGESVRFVSKVPTLRFKAQIKHPDKDYTPIALIVKKGSQSSIDTDYTPPMLFLPKQSRIVEDLQKVISFLRIQLRNIEGKIDNYNASQSFSTTYFSALKFSALLHITLPQLILAIEQDRINTMQLFSLLSSLSSTVKSSVYNRLYIPECINWENLNASFSDAMSSIKTHCSLVANEVVEAVQLKFVEDKNLFIFVHNKSFESGENVYFKVDKSDADINAAIIDESSKLNNTIKQRFVGLPRKICSDLEIEQSLKIRAATGNRFFCISKKHLKSGTEYSIDFNQQPPKAAFIYKTL